MAEAVRRVVKKSGTRTRDVAMALPPSAVITKKIILPGGMSDAELETQVESEANQYIPFSLEEVSLDFCIVGPSSTSVGDVEVLIAASRKEKVQDRQGLAEAAGLKPVIIDVESYALENACSLMRHQLPDGGIDRSVAIIDFGASTTTFSVLRDLKLIYTRDFAFGGQQLTEAIMRTYGLTIEEAGRAKKEGGLPGNYQSEVLDPFIDDMNQQVLRALQFYMASSADRDPLDKLLVCGGCANIPGVADVIASRVGIAAEKGDPLGQMRLTPRARSQAVQRDSTALLVALGLALRGFD